MNARLRSLLDELSYSMISEWLNSREIYVVQYSENHQLSKTEKAITRRIKAVRAIPDGTRNFYFVDAKKSNKRHIVIVYKDLTMSYLSFEVSSDKVELIKDEKHDFIYPSALKNAIFSSWTVFLINTFGDAIWNYYFFRQIDVNIIREYVLSTRITEDESPDIMLLFETDYCKVFFLVDDKGFENRIQVNYKLDCMIFRSVSRIQDWNSGRKKSPSYTEVLESLKIRDFSRQNYYNFINDDS